MSNGTPWQEVSRNVGNLCGDAFELTELQVAMLRSDFRNFRHRILYAVIMIPVAIGMFLAGLPVLALALAGTIAEVFGISALWGQWIVGGSFFILAGLMAYLGARITVRSLRAFNASQREFEANLRWLRQMVGKPRPINPTAQNEYIER